MSKKLPETETEVSERKPERPKKKGVPQVPAKPRTFQGGGTTEVTK